MPRDPNRIARLYRKLSPDDDATPKRNVPTAWVVGLVALLVLALPLAVFGSALGGGDDAGADMAAVRLSEDDGDAAASDDERDRDDRDPTARETIDGNTLRNGDNSITGNTKIGDTTERPTQDGNTLRNGDNSITGNTRAADTTRAPAAARPAAAAPAAAPAPGRAAAPSQRSFAPAYAPARGDASVSAASVSRPSAGAASAASVSAASVSG